MKRRFGLVHVALNLAAITLDFAWAFISAKASALINYGAAADEEALSAPGWWPFAAAVVLVGAAALSAFFPWGFA